MTALTVVVKIIRVLGEGGFSFVYLVEDEHSGVRASFTQLLHFLHAIADPSIYSAPLPSSHGSICSVPRSEMILRYLLISGHTSSWP